MQDDLATLISQAQRGEKDAFGEIYKLFLKRIFRFIYFSVHDREVAADLTQNTFLRAWRAIQTFSLAKGSFQAFLFTIARNLAIDWQRKKKPLPLEKIGEYEASDNLEENFERREKSQLVRQVLDKLGERDKQIIILRYFEELTFFEIAKILGKKEGAVRVRVHRVLKKLKSFLSG